MVSLYSFVSQVFFWHACFFIWLFLPQLEVLMKLYRQHWNQTWFCQKIQRKQLTSRTPLKISVQLYFPWKYHRYDFHFTKSYFTKSINITIFYFFSYWGLFTFYIIPQRFQMWSLSSCRNSRCVIKTVKMQVLPDVMLCMGFLQTFLLQIDNKTLWAH